MKKILILLSLSMFILTGCFDKKTRADNGSDSDYLGITNFTEGTGTTSGGSTGVIGGSSSVSSGTPIIIDSSTIVPIDKVVTINFTESINAQTVNSNTIFIADSSGNPIPATLTVIDNQINITPNEFFTPDSRYTIVVTTEVQDIRGRSLEGLFNYTFPTGPDILTPPNLLRVSPADGTIASPATDIVMTFSEDIVGNASIILVDTSTNRSVDGNTNIVGNTLRFTPNNPLNYSTEYRATLDGTVEDLDGNSYLTVPTWSFSISAQNDVDAPTLEALTPEDDSEANIETYVVMYFNEQIAGNGNLLVTLDGSNVAIAGTTAIIDNFLRFIPQNYLDYGENYTVTLEGTIEDLSGNVYSGQSNWHFSTEQLPVTPPPVDTTAPTLTLLTPLNGAIDVSKSTDVSMVFDEDISDNGVTLEVRDSLNVLVSGINTVSANILTFNPDIDLSDDELYTVTVQNDVEDLSGNVYTGVSNWSFTTVTVVVPPPVDGTPPILILLTPLKDAIDVNKTTNISMTFDENIKDTDPIMLVFDDATSILVAGTVSVSDNSVTFTPDTTLLDGATYTVILVGTIEDLSGNVYVGETSWSFSTTVVISPPTDTTPPTLVGFIPSSGDTNVDKTTHINVIFDENVTNGGVNLYVTADPLGIPVAGMEGISGDTMWFIPTSDLIEDQNYTVVILGPTNDLSGNTYTGETTWNFRVAPPLDSTPPTLTSLTPTSGETDVDKTTDISMVFGEDIADNNATLDVRDSLNVLVDGVNTVSANTLNFNPNNDLNDSETYIVTLQNNVEDLAGNVYIGTSTWSFTTTVVTPIDTTPPTLTLLTPLHSAINVDSGTDINMTFSEDVTNTGTGLKLTNDTLGTPVGGDNGITGDTLWFIPDSVLIEDHNYTVNMLGTTRDLSGNVYVGQKVWSFTVAPLVDMTPPTMTSLTPADGKIDVDSDTNINIVFNEDINNTGETLILTDNTLASTVSGASGVSADTLWFIPNSRLIEEHNYTVAIDGETTDLAGNVYTGVSNWSFVVVPFEVSSVRNDLGNIVTIVFSDYLNPATVSESDFGIDPGDIVPGTFFHWELLKTVTFLSDANLTGGEIISISGTIEDTMGNSVNDGIPMDYTL